MAKDDGGNGVFLARAQDMKAALLLLKQHGHKPRFFFKAWIPALAHLLGYVLAQFPKHAARSQWVHHAHGGSM
ncbi:hypothetical protein GCM10007338_20860 [Corynebacterium pelargi]|nr:hypothetical protein GCM10007338_20860 [Corynebacterium pelargi]